MGARVIGCGFAVALSLAATTALAGEPAVRLDRFTPAPGDEGLWQVEGPPRIGPPIASVAVEHAVRPLVLHDPGESEDAAVVPYQTTMHLGFDIGVASFLRLYSSFPFTLAAQAPDPGATDIGVEGDVQARAGLGDMLLGARAAALTSEHVDLGASVFVTLPTATGSYWNGSGTVAVEGRATSALHFGPVDFLLDIGARYRPEVDLMNVTVGPEVTAGLGARVTPIDWLQLGVEVLGDTGLTEQTAFQEATSRVEMMARARIQPWRGWGFDVGGGVGLVDGYGTPAGRFLTAISIPVPPYAGVRSTPSTSDSSSVAKRRAPAAAVALTPPPTPGAQLASDGDADDDGIPDSADRCVNVPEDLDGIVDSDGCPEGGANASPTVVAHAEKSGTAELAAAFRELSMVHFDTNSDVVRSEYKGAVMRAAIYLSLHPEVGVVTLTGHTDARGSDGHNLELAQRRAVSVTRSLITLGVAPERLRVAGYGSTSPLVAETNDDKTRAINRRVEIHPDRARDPAGQ